MKKKILVIITFAILVLLFLYFRYIYGWYEFQFYRETPKKYMNHTRVNKKEYSFDSLNIILQTKDFIKNHEESFYSKEYDEYTQIIIDTILYSPNYKKIATFITVKKPTSNQLMPDKKNNWYYDGFLYIGDKNNNSLKINSTEAGRRNYTDIKELSNILEELFLKKYSSTKDNNGNKRLYNLDDTRYWDKSIDWKNLEYNRKLKKDFEEEKLKNPENIYETK